MRRRREDNRRINAFAKQIALRELGKLSPSIPMEVDPGFPTTPEWIFDNYMPYRDKDILPCTGGWSDQGDSEIAALLEMDHRVAWYMENEQKPNLPSYDEVWGARRRALEAKQDGHN